MNCPTRELLASATSGDAGAGRLVADHVRECALCRGIAEGLRTSARGRCLTEEQALAFVRRTASPADLSVAEEHVSRCEACLSEVTAVADLLRTPAPDAPVDFLSRALRLDPALRVPVRPATRSRLPRTTRRTAPPRTTLFLPVAAAAAAAVLLVLTFDLAGTPDHPAAPMRTASRQKPPVAPVTPPPAPTPASPGTPPVTPPSLRNAQEPPAAPVTEPARAVARTPSTEAPSSPPAAPVVSGPNPVAAEPATSPAPTPENPRATPTEAEAQALQVTPVAGDLYLKSGTGATVPVKGPIRLTPADLLTTGPRGPASFEIPDVHVVLRPDSALQAPSAGPDRTTLRLPRGEAYIEKSRSEQALVISTPSAEAAVSGTEFSVGVDGRSTVLTVVAGEVRFSNVKGEVRVGAGQQSRAAENLPPGSPKPLPDAAQIVAWARRPDLRGDATKEMFVEVLRGGNDRLRGVVIACPYPDWEIASGDLARSVALSMDLPLVLGHHYREKSARKVWFDVDRSTEHEVLADGSLGPVVSTARACEAFSGYSSAFQAAAGNMEPGSRNPAPPADLVVSVRGHDLAQPDGPVTVCEIAHAGIPRPLLLEAKRRVEALVARTTPAPKILFRFDGPDNPYDYHGARRPLTFVEDNTRGDGGYMNPRHSRRAIALFFPAEPGGDAALCEAVLRELVGFLAGKR